MAAEIDDDSEFQLPSGFLSDLEMLTDFDPDPTGPRSDEFSYGFGDSVGFRSDLNSPVESVICTNETESDDDDSITELSRRVAHSSMLFDSTAEKNRNLSSSPQSTLCGFKPVLRRDQSSVSSSGSTSCAIVDSIDAASAEAAKRRIGEETPASYSGEYFAAARKFLPISTERRFSGTGVFLSQTQIQTQLSYQQSQAAKKIKRQQMLMNWINEQGTSGKEQQIQDASKNNSGGGRSQGLSMASRPNLQQAQKLPNSGMRAVFLGDTGPQKERVGTGVFMPRRFDKKPAESKKKSAYSTVLLPERVVQALNLHMDSSDSLLHLRSKDSESSMKMKHNPTMNNTNPAMNHEEHQLPGEWTY